jgi:hypothetical protein
VPVFPVENPLELIKRHLVVNLLVLGSFLVFIEGFFPFQLIQRWNDADNRLPFDDREAGMRQAGHAADNENGKDHGAADRKARRQSVGGERFIHGRFRGDKKEANYRLFRLSAPCDNVPHHAATLCLQAHCVSSAAPPAETLVFPGVLDVDQITNTPNAGILPGTCAQVPKILFSQLHSAPRAPNNDGG